MTAKNQEDLTPLHVAVDSDKFDVVKCLVEKGVKVGSKEMEKHPSPLYLALFRRNIAIFEYLIKYGAKVNAKIGPKKHSLLHKTVIKRKFIPNRIQGCLNLQLLTLCFGNELFIFNHILKELMKISFEDYIHR